MLVKYNFADHIFSFLLFSFFSLNSIYLRVPLNPEFCREVAEFFVFFLADFGGLVRNRRKMDTIFFNFFILFLLPNSEKNVVRPSFILLTLIAGTIVHRNSQACSKYPWFYGFFAFFSTFFTFFSFFLLFSHFQTHTKTFSNLLTVTSHIFHVLLTSFSDTFRTSNSMIFLILA